MNTNKCFKFLVGIMFLLVKQITFSQTTSIKTPQITSPEVSGILKFSEHPVNMYTGIPSISVPIFDINFDGIKIPISLQYHASGIRVDEVASNVGLGWNLSYGGVVTRTIRDKDDLQQNTLTNINYADNLPLFYDPVYNVHGGSSTYIGVNCGQSPKGIFFESIDNGGLQTDLEFDLFTFTLPNGNSAKFMQFMDGGYKTMPLSNYKIERVHNANSGVFEYWKIIDEFGFNYYFGKDPIRNTQAHEITSISSSTTNPLQTSNTESNSSWFLMRIVSPYGKLVEYNYENTVFEYKSSRTETLFYFDNSGNYNLVNSNQKRVTDSYNRYYTTRVKSIIFPEGKVEFNYGAEKKDVLSVDPGNVNPNERPRVLQNLDVFNKNNNIIKRASFTYNYFSPVGTQDGSNINISNYLDYRLKLEKVELFNNTLSDNNAYIFKYEEGVNLPNRMSPKKDFWGYYNNKLSATNTYLPSLTSYPIWYGSSAETIGTGLNSFVMPYIAKVYRATLDLEGADKSADITFSKANTLKEIIYPTGGSAQFFFENHVIKYFQNFHPTNPVTAPVEIFTHNFEGDLSENEEFVFNPSENPNTVHSTNPLMAGVHYEVYFGGGDFINNVFAIRFFCVNTNTFFDVTSTSTSTTGNVSGTATLVKGNTYKISIVPWGSNNLSSFSASVKVSWSILANTAPGYTDFNKTIGGLRIKEIKYFTEAGKIDKLTSFQYSEDINGQEISTGEILEYPDICSVTPNSLGYGNALGITVNSEASSPFLSPSSTHVGYLKVTKIDKSINSTEEQKSEYTFLPSLFEMVDYHQLIDILPIPYDFADWRRGLPSSETVMLKKGNSYVPLKEVSFGYSFKGLDGEKFTNINYKHKGNPNGTSTFRRYTISTERFWKNSVVVRDYDYSTSSPANTYTQTNYYYENASYQSPTKIETWNSKGEKVTTDFQYPYNFSSGSPYSEMLSRNMIGTPIQQTQTQTFNNVTKTLSTSKTNYSLFQNNILPSSLQNSKGSNALETDVNISQYDDKGNIEEFISKDGIVNSFIWGYNKLYPVAKVVGKTHSEIVAASGGLNMTIINNPLTSDADMRLELNKIRALSGCFVTTYTYKPLVGITSETDPNGKTIYYEYDSFNRLKLIKDQDGKILKVFDYKYQANTNQ